MKKVSIIGFGRFGRTLYRLLKDDFSIILYDKKIINIPKSDINTNTIVTKNLNEVYESDVIFFAVPISIFENVIKTHRKYFKSTHLLIDVLSVKIHPKKVLINYLKGLRTEALLTHPMFGPDSSKNGFEDLPIVIDKFKASKSNYNYWKNIFIKKKLKAVELSAEEHDRLSAKSQALSHFLGRGLKDIRHQRTSIDTKGASLLSDLIDLTTNDSIQLFKDLQKFNPYTKKVRSKLIKSLTKINNELK